MPGHRQGEPKLGSCWWKEGGCKGAQHNLPLYPAGQSCVGAQNPYRGWEPQETQLGNAIPTHPMCPGVWVRSLLLPCSSSAGSLGRSRVSRSRAGEGCGHMVVLCWLLSACCQVGNWLWRGQFGHWSIHCHGSEPGWICSPCQDL